MPSPRLYVEQIGTGLPVLAIHGWTVDHRLMTGCLEPVFAARPGYRRIYPDLPAMGNTPADGVNSSDDILAAVEALIEAEIGAEPFLLVGESFGGYLARALAVRHASHLRGLALICPMVDGRPREQRIVPELEVRRPDPDLVASLDVAEAGYTELAVVQSPATLADHRANIAPAVAVADMAALERIGQRWSLSAPVVGSPLRVPTLIVTGRQDNSVGYVEQIDLLDQYPHATFAILDVAGHNAQAERPELFGALVADWLDRVATEPAR